MGKIIAIANQKGGVGKTTTAINLGESLSHLNHKVLIVDLDPQGNACSGLGIEKENQHNSVYEVLMQAIHATDAIRSTQVAGLDIIPVNMNLIGAQIELVESEDRETRLKHALTPIKDQYDYILIDCPPSLGLLTLNGLVAADSVMIPLQCEYFALEGLTQLMRTIGLVQKALNPNLELEGVLMTMFDSRTSLSNQVYEEAIRYFKKKVYKTIIPRNVKLGEAPSFGKPIHSYDALCPGSQSYSKLAKEMIHHG